MEHYDFLRTAIIHEPRGHGNMYSAVITPPTVEEAEFGQFFLCPRGYPTMCGHGTMGVVTVMIETGAISYSGSSRTVVIDTPVGMVEAKAEIDDGEVKGVTLKNIPAFLLMSDVSVNVKGFRKIQVDIAFAGNFFYAQVDADKLQLSLDSENKNQLISLGLSIRETINQTISTVHPEDPEIKGVSAVDFFGKPSHPEAHYKDIHVYGTGQIDRSPCGTGTCAKMANLFTKGKLGLNKEYVQEGLSGEIFRGRIVGQTKVGGLTAIIPEVSGTAFITGINQLIIDKNDPLKYGINLS